MASTEYHKAAMRYAERYLERLLETEDLVGRRTGGTPDETGDKRTSNRPANGQRRDTGSRGSVQAGDKRG
ncbi:MAG: hypothetical protein IJ722_00930 [Alloprevotella sp.]|nr:hypothetical protein [Alloprevotella sp.]